MENANFALPYSRAGPCSAPDVPPGFPPQQPKTCTFAAAESSRNQNPISKENVHGQSQRPDFYAEQPPRRTSRKRSRPQFYAPPTARHPATSPRRRGRPPKARLMSQLCKIIITKLFFCGFFFFFGGNCACLS